MPWRSVAPKRSSSLATICSMSCAVLDDLGVRVAHQLDDAIDEPHEERVFHAEEATVPDRSAQQAAQHVARGPRCSGARRRR